MKILFNNKEIEATFCQKCQDISEEEKAIICLGQIIKSNPDKNVSDILKIMGMNIDE